MRVRFGISIFTNMPVRKKPGHLRDSWRFSERRQGYARSRRRLAMRWLHRNQSQIRSCRSIDCVRFHMPKYSWKVNVRKVPTRSCHMNYLQQISDRWRKITEFMTGDHEDSHELCLSREAPKSLTDRGLTDSQFLELGFGFTREKNSILSRSN